MAHSCHTESTIMQAVLYTFIATQQPMNNPSIFLCVLALSHCLPGLPPLTSQVAKQRLESDSSLAEKSSLTVTEIVTLLEFCLDTTYLRSIPRVLFRQSMAQQWVPTISSHSQPTVVRQNVKQGALATFPTPEF